MTAWLSARDRSPQTYSRSANFQDQMVPSRLEGDPCLLHRGPPFSAGDWGHMRAQSVRAKASSRRLVPGRAASAGREDGEVQSGTETATQSPVAPPQGFSAPPRPRRLGGHPISVQTAMAGLSISIRQVGVDSPVSLRDVLLAIAQWITCRISAAGLRSPVPDGGAASTSRRSAGSPTASAAAGTASSAPAAPPPRQCRARLHG